MKGMIFTEFLDLVEETWGLETSEHIIEASQLKSGGIYTAVGNYEAGELLAMVAHLSAKVKIPVADLQVVFGKRIFALFTRNYGRFFTEAKGAFAFLAGIEHYIHVEVRKLYPDAELPSFSYPQHAVNTLVMEYRSRRPMAHFALGLIQATVAHYGENITVTMDDLSGGIGNAARYTLVRG